MDLRELPVLNVLKSLKSIIFHNNVEDTNPFCRNRLDYLKNLSRLTCINNILVDNMNIEQIINEERGVVVRGSEEDIDPDAAEEIIYQNFNQKEISKKNTAENKLNTKTKPVYKISSQTQNSAQISQKQNFMN